MNKLLPALLLLAACQPAAPPPIEATSADPRSPEAARALVARYVVLLQTKKYDDAFALWAHGEPQSAADRAKFRARFADIAAYEAQVGKPSRPEGACGSIYVQVPIHVTGRTTAGRPVDTQQIVNVRRVNDVDGSSAAQRRWHIDSVDG